MGQSPLKSGSPSMRRYSRGGAGDRLSVSWEYVLLPKAVTHYHSLVHSRAVSVRQVPGSPGNQLRLEAGARQSKGYGHRRASPCPGRPKAHLNHGQLGLAEPCQQSDSFFPHFLSVPHFLSCAFVTGLFIEARDTEKRLWSSKAF